MDWQLYKSNQIFDIAQYEIQFNYVFQDQPLTSHEFTAETTLSAAAKPFFPVLNKLL